jgi:hypothetical protein
MKYNAEVCSQPEATQKRMASPTGTYSMMYDIQADSKANFNRLVGDESVLCEGTREVNCGSTALEMLIDKPP